VIATAVGEVKTELVFHGDTMNTTARLCTLCTALGVDLIVSSDLVARLPERPALGLVDMGTHSLRGKEHTVAVFTLADQAPTLGAVTLEVQRV
jgi:adenylate cyclase